ncbi:MAG: insulinase family protein [Deltaproteobacteria bacterium]|nr:insulinase family protein [Deltaproteobacteria bacterium]
MINYIPEIYQSSLPGGLNLIGMEYDRVPWVSLTFMVKRGAETDPPGKAGAADWAAEFLTLGTARRNQLELATDIESRGAALKARGGFDAVMVSLEGLAEDFPQLMATMAEIVQTPGFPEEEFPLLKERRRAELTHLLDEPREMANIRFLKLFFGDAPYGHPAQGTLESVAVLELKDLQDFYRREFSPRAASLVVVGMVEAAQVEPEAARNFGAWTGGGSPSPTYLAAPEKLCAPGIYLWDRPELTQSEIRMGHLGLPRSHPDFFALKLVNYILGGGGFSSRLMTRIRSDLGLTYGIRSQFHFRRAPGPFVVSTFTPAAKTAQVVKEITRVMTEVERDGVTPQELAEAQSYHVGHFPLGLETPQGLARQLLSVDLYDLGRDYLKKYCDEIRTVTLETAAQAAQIHLRPESLVTLVMGPASQCAAALQELGPVTFIQES